MSGFSTSVRRKDASALFQFTLSIKNSAKIEMPTECIRHRSNGLPESGLGFGQLALILEDEAENEVGFTVTGPVLQSATANSFRVSQPSGLKILCSLCRAVWRVDVFKLRVHRSDIPQMNLRTTNDKHFLNLKLKPALPVW